MPPEPIEEPQVNTYCQGREEYKTSGEHRDGNVRMGGYWDTAVEHRTREREALEIGAAALVTSSDDPEQGHSAVRMLLKRSALAQAMKDVPRCKSILIIEDNQRDSDRLASTLRTIFGYDTTVRQCRTLGTALDAVLSEQPDIVFLDDRLGPVDKAEKSVSFLRNAQCKAMIFVVSSYVDRRRRAELLALSVDEVIDKDELDSTSICQALISALARKGR